MLTSVLEPWPPRGRSRCHLSVLSDVLEFALAAGQGQLVQLPLGHRFVRGLQGTLELDGFLIAAFGRQGCTGALLLRFRFCRHHALLVGSRRAWPRREPALPPA